MISKPEQFSKVILTCMERFSKDTTTMVGALLTSHERVIVAEQILKTNPTEEELIQKLDSIQTESYET